MVDGGGDCAVHRGAGDIAVGVVVHTRGRAMNAFVMTYRAQGGALRLQPLLARSMADAWVRAFDLAEALGCSPVCGFCVRRVGGAA